MILTENQKGIQNLLATALGKAWEDETFKQELLVSPIDAIEKLTGERLNLKDGAKMVAIDQTDHNTFYFNITAKPDLDNIELNEEQLELVAGGGEKWEIFKAIVKESFHLGTYQQFR